MYVLCMFSSMYYNIVTCKGYYSESCLKCCGFIATLKKKNKTSPVSNNPLSFIWIISKSLVISFIQDLHIYILSTLKQNKYMNTEK